MFLTGRLAVKGFALQTLKVGNIRGRPEVGRGRPERPALMATMDELENTCEAGPLSELARHALAAHAGDVMSRLDELDAFADVLRTDRR
jgi:hypothetical protein